MLTNAELKKQYIDVFLKDIPPATGNLIYDLLRENMLNYVEAIGNLDDDVFADAIKSFGENNEIQAMRLALGLN